MVVHFPHGGGEHKPRGAAEMAWNRGDHARKFLRADATYVENGETHKGSVTFWGEWEPPSAVTALPRTGPDEPRYLHDPFWSRPRDKSGLQNTDPLVFGERFLYSNCRQRGNRKLRRLAPGSLVLFGSTLHGEFVLDTAFVVGESEEYTRRTTRHLDVPAWTRAVVFDPLCGGEGDDTFRLYRGRRPDDGDGPYSFVPCLPYRADGSGFARPVIRLPWLNPRLTQGAGARPADARRVRDVWTEVVNQVEAAGLCLGVELAPPPQRRSTVPEQSGDGSCAPKRRRVC